MEKPTPIKSVFRKWPDGTIDAYFPYEPADFNRNITCYSRIGQHSAADYDACIDKTVPAKPHEYQPLLQELQRIGYDVTVIKRANKTLMSKAYRDMLSEFI